MALAVATPVDPKAVQIVSSENVGNGDGTFKYSFETEEGTKVRAEGTLEGTGDEAYQVISGGYSYTDSDGKLHDIKYKADTNGYRPEVSS